MTEPLHSSDRTWRGRESRPGLPAPRQSTSRGKLAGVAAAVCVIAGVIVGLLLWIRPVTEPYFLGVWIDNYGDGLVPRRPWVESDRSALLALPWQEKDAFAEQERRLL